MGRVEKIIDCNRYSIAIFFSFYSSNALEPLLL